MMPYSEPVVAQVTTCDIHPAAFIVLLECKEPTGLSRDVHGDRSKRGRAQRTLQLQGALPTLMTLALCLFCAFGISALLYDVQVGRSHHLLSNPGALFRAWA